MLRPSFTVGLLLLLGCGSQGVVRTTSAGAVHDGAAGGTDRGEPTLAEGVPHAWLYRVTGGPSAEPSYLLGTMHLGVTFREAVPSPLDSALYRARAVALEIDAREAGDFVARLPRESRPRRAWLDRTLPRETWTRLTTELSRVAPPESIQRASPEFVALYLQQVRMAEVEALLDGRAPIPGAVSSTRLDRSIFEWAIASGLPFVAMETWEESFAALDGIPDTDVLPDLIALIDDPESARAEARHLREAYLSFEEAQIAAVIASEPPAVNEALLLRRNRAWMRNLIPLLEGGGTFVAVGCAHLIGEGSVPALLLERGYTVERVLGDGGLTPSDSGRVRMARR